MEPEEKFLAFLESLKDGENDGTLDVVSTGFKTIAESESKSRKAVAMGDDPSKSYKIMDYVDGKGKGKGKKKPDSKGKTQTEYSSKISSQKMSY